MSDPPVLSRDEVCQVVQRHLGSGDLEVSRYSLSPLGPDVKGFMADHLRLRVAVSGQPQLEFFVKTVPLTDAYRRQFALAGLSYQKEVLFYGEVVRTMGRHLRGGGSEAATLLGAVPRCLHLRPDLLVLEDLGAAGFRGPAAARALGPAECAAVLRALARLHGAGLVCEERERRPLAAAFPLLTRETLYLRRPGDEQYAAQQESVRCLHALLDRLPHYGASVRRRVDAAMDTIYDLVQHTDKYRNVVCHRDLWTNNLLLAADASGRLAARLVDFQAARLFPASYDVLTLLHLSTSRDTRTQHGPRLLELYHRELADVLRAHDLDVDRVLPFQVFLESCEDAKRLAVLLAVHIIHFVILPLQQGFDLAEFVHNRRDMVIAAFERDENYRKRVTETVDDLVETFIMPQISELQD